MRLTQHEVSTQSGVPRVDVVDCYAAAEEQPEQSGITQERYAMDEDFAFFRWHCLRWPEVQKCIFDLDYPFRECQVRWRSWLEGQR